MRFRGVLAGILLAGLLACGDRGAVCSVCEREIHPTVQVNLTMEDGSRVRTCCPRCALHFLEETGRRASGILAADYPSGGAVPLREAFLVEGSDETPCLKHLPQVTESKSPLHFCYDRCLPSLVAFRDQAAAVAFVRDHGGTLHRPGGFPGLPPENP
ncbi:MAG: hypothetical protein HY509_06050 [Acidobacteria bacterium]|nr:hypothetical protein [Acidobacteriota bacterium]